MKNLGLLLFSAFIVLRFVQPAELGASTLYTTILKGSNEVPPTGSTATGSAAVSLSGDILTVIESFTGLSGLPTGAHIHCCGPIGVNEPVAVPFTGFPSAASGSYSKSFDLTLSATYTSAFLTAEGGTAAAAEAAFIAGLNGGQAYANIHDANFPGGEIRGQLQAVPEPSGLFLLGLLPGIALVRKYTRDRRPA